MMCFLSKNTAHVVLLKLFLSIIIIVVLYYHAMDKFVFELHNYAIIKACSFCVL